MVTDGKKIVRKNLVFFSWSYVIKWHKLFWVVFHKTQMKLSLPSTRCCVVKNVYFPSIFFSIFCVTLKTSKIILKSHIFQQIVFWTSHTIILTKYKPYFVRLERRKFEWKVNHFWNIPKGMWPRPIQWI